MNKTLFYKKIKSMTLLLMSDKIDKKNDLNNQVNGRKNMINKTIKLG